MIIDEITVGDIVLVQSGHATKERAVVKGLNPNNNLVIIRNSFGDIIEIKPEYILKSFGQ